MKLCQNLKSIPIPKSGRLRASDVADFEGLIALVSLEHARPQAIATPAAEENGATSANDLS